MHRHAGHRHSKIQTCKELANLLFPLEKIPVGDWSIVDITASPEE